MRSIFRGVVSFAMPHFCASADRFAKRSSAAGARHCLSRHARHLQPAASRHAGRTPETNPPCRTPDLSEWTRSPPPR